MKIIEVFGKRFQVEIEQDSSIIPWEFDEAHGPVSDWTTRDKRAGEMVLAVDGRHRRYYDFETAMKIAKRDGWGCSELKGNETAGEKAYASVMSDYKFLQGWCQDLWCYNTVTVTQLDENGEPTANTNSLGAVDDYNPDYLNVVARELAEDIAK